ncbi:MAG: SDR family NAD(P)-dependent oxidoreductase [Chloroflexi bacterium]|nr:SDR family NAD(P)-dependent oxidoreductase [Chloroflexota bacterium]
MIELANSVALVTGASRGIGRALALALAKAGVRVVCAGRTLDGPLERGSLRHTVDLIATDGGRGIAVACDVTDPSSVAALIERGEQEFGGLDLIINDAGYYPRSTIAEMDPTMWAAALDVNLSGPFLVCRYALPGMIRRGSGGNILNITSGSATRYDRRHIAYSVAKAGLDRFTMNLAEEVREHGIAVNALDPGLVKTEMNNFYESGDAPEAITPAALWLLTQDPSTMSGRVVSRKGFGQEWP